MKLVSGHSWVFYKHSLALEHILSILAASTTKFPAEAHTEKQESSVLVGPIETPIYAPPFPQLRMNQQVDIHRELCEEGESL